MKLLYSIMGNPLDRAIEQFLTMKKPKADRTQQFYATGLRQFRAFSDAWPPDAATIANFIEDCKQRNLTKGSVHAYYRAVRGFCYWLHKSKLIKENPIHLVSAPPQPKRKIPRAPKREIVKAFIKHLEETVERNLRVKLLMEDWLPARDLAIISLMYDTGMRVGEVARLDLEDIDLGRRVVHVREAKDSEERDLAFDVMAKADLNLWLKVRGELNPPERLTNLFISFYQGEYRRLTIRGIEEMFDARCKEARVERFTPHAVRHAFSSQWLANGGSLNALQQILGHANIATTSIYTMMHLEQVIEEHKISSPRNSVDGKI